MRYKRLAELFLEPKRFPYSFDRVQDSDVLTGVDIIIGSK